MEPNKVEKYSLLVLGTSRVGKTAFAYTLTNDEQKFEQKFGNSSQTQEINHSVSKEVFQKERGLKFTVFDAVGYFNDDKSIQFIFNDTMDYLKNNTKIEEYLDAVVLVLQFGAASDFERLISKIKELWMIETDKNTKILTNLIIIMTNFDTALKDESEKDISRAKQEAYDKFAKYLGNDCKKKVLFWINGHHDPETNKKRLKKPKVKESFEKQFAALVSAIKMCSKYKLELVHRYSIEMRKVFLKGLSSLFLRKEIARELKSFPFLCSFTLKFDCQGRLSEDYEKGLDFKVLSPDIGGNLLGGTLGTGLAAGVGAAVANAIAVNVVSNGVRVGAAYVFSTAGLGTLATSAAEIGIATTTTGAIVIGTTTAATLATGGIAIAAGLLSWSIYKIYKKYHTKKLDTTESLRNILKLKSGNFKNLVNDFVADNGLTKFVILQMSNTENKKEITFEITEESKDNLPKTFNNYMKILKVDVISLKCAIRASIDQKQEVVKLNWDFNETKNLSATVSLNISLGIELPKDDIIEKELEKIMQGESEKIWRNIKGN